MRRALYFLYILIQCTWGSVQTLIGFLMFLRFIGCEHSFYHGCIKTVYSRNYSVSLGMYIFVSNRCQYEEARKLAVHEYGHTIQSLMLGPLYLFVIGVTSYIWCRLPYFKKMRAVKGIPYSTFWVESWADRLGETAIKKVVDTF